MFSPSALLPTHLVSGLVTRSLGMGTKGASSTGWQKYAILNLSSPAPFGENDSVDCTLQQSVRPVTQQIADVD